MANILLRYELNRDINFVKIMNFLVAYQIMTLEQSHNLYKQFRQGQDVVFAIEDEMVPLFTNELNSLNWKHE